VTRWRRLIIETVSEDHDFRGGSRAYSKCGRGSVNILGGVIGGREVDDRRLQE